MPHYRVSGIVWQVELSNEEANNVASAAGAVAGSTAPFATVAAAALAAVAGVIVTVNQIGGGQGVNVVGVLTTQLVTVTPRFVSPVGVVSAFAQALHHATGLPGGVVGAGLGAGLALLAAGPAGVVVGGFAGAIGAAIGGGGGANPGDVHANRAAVGPWEKFLLVTLSPNNVAINSWRGFFCAENGGGGPVHANRSQILAWETHTLLRNPNGTVSFRASGGHFLVAESGGGSVCNWNRTAIGPWEQFWMEFQSDGTFALKTFQSGQYVSVQ